MKLTKGVLKKVLAAMPIPSQKPVKKEDVILKDVEPLLVSMAIDELYRKKRLQFMPPGVYIQTPKGMKGFKGLSTTDIVSIIALITSIISVLIQLIR